MFNSLLYYQYLAWGLADSRMNEVQAPLQIPRTCPSTLDLSTWPFLCLSCQVMCSAPLCHRQPHSSPALNLLLVNTWKSRSIVTFGANCYYPGGVQRKYDVEKIILLLFLSLTFSQITSYSCLGKRNLPRHGVPEGSHNIGKGIYKSKLNMTVTIVQGSWTKGKVSLSPSLILLF